VICVVLGTCSQRASTKIKAVIAVDDAEQVRIITGGVGSKRYRVFFSGPGGHSYSAFGLVNPAFAMGNAIAKLARLKLTDQPKTTFNVGVVSGGTSVNSIPVKVSMDVDLRSESKEELNKLVDAFTAFYTKQWSRKTTRDQRRKGPSP
jgi:tripeptide aminopeptidase